MGLAKHSRQVGHKSRFVRGLAFGEGRTNVPSQNGTYGLLDELCQQTVVYRGCKERRNPMPSGERLKLFRSGEPFFPKKGFPFSWGFMGACPRV